MKVKRGITRKVGGDERVRKAVKENEDKAKCYFMFYLDINPTITIFHNFWKMF